MNAQEAVDRTSDRVKLPDWFWVPEGSDPYLAEVHVETTRHFPAGGEPFVVTRGEGRVVWRPPPPDWKWAELGVPARSRWFDLADLELVGED